VRPLRNFGVYQPPHGIRPVYAVPAGDDYYLYDAEYGVLLHPRFKVEAGGRVTDWHGEAAEWTAADLVDTGETHDPTQQAALPPP
jgi:hypothetical protein